MEKKIDYLLNAVENNDFTFKFTELKGSKSNRMFNQALNRIKDLISAEKMRVRGQEAYYGFILENVITGIVTINSRGDVLLCNVRARLLLGMPVFTSLSQLSRIDADLPGKVASLTAGDSCSVSFYNESGEVNLIIKASDYTGAFEGGKTSKFGRVTGKVSGNMSDDLSGDNVIKILSINDIGEELDIKETESWIKLTRVLTHEIMNLATPIVSISDSLIEMCNSKCDSDSNIENMPKCDPSDTDSGDTNTNTITDTDIDTHSGDTNTDTDTDTHSGDTNTNTDTDTDTDTHSGDTNTNTDTDTDTHSGYTNTPAGAPPAAVLQDALEAINTTSKGLVSFIDTYRKFSVIPTPVKEEFNLNVFLAKLDVLFAVKMKEHLIDFSVKRLESASLRGVYLCADESLITLVVMNIVNNAIIAVSRNEISDTDIRPHSKRKIEISVTISDKEIIFEISNNGLPIPEEEKDQIFVPFYTTLSSGTGIGLSISRQIMRLHNGSLKLKESTSYRTTFQFNLPRVFTK